METVVNFAVISTIFFVFLLAEARNATAVFCNATDECCVRFHAAPLKTELDCTGIQNVPYIFKPVHMLSIKDSAMKELPTNSINMYKTNLTELVLIDLKNLEKLDSSTLKNLNVLQSLYISGAKSLKELPSDVFYSLSKSFSVLNIRKSNLKAIPDLSRLGTSKPMHTIEIEGNRIDALPANGVKTRVDQLLLEYNNIHVIENWAFNGSEIAKLSLKGNYLDYLSEHSFDGINNLLTLDLSYSSMKVLPTSGLRSIEILQIESTPTMTTIPSIYAFANLKEAHLTYSFHCCSFQFPAKYDFSSYEFKQDEIERKSSDCDRMNMNSGEASEDYEVTEFGNSDEKFFDEPAIATGTRKIVCGNITPPMMQSNVLCSPRPDALNPCEDIMGYYWLRISVWVVGVAALLANLVVLLLAFRKRSVHSAPRFLMSNLAFADFCTAIYLLLLAYEDLESSEKYFNYAYSWQNGIGCKIGGFLTVFSSQLSVFALCLLTIERWYSIRRALYTNKMTFTSTVKIMAFGWVYSITMAVMPLLGISSYSTTSICLPMDTDRAIGALYVFTLLTFAACAFLLMLLCYVHMYSSLSYETRHAVQGEASVARKIFVLVGTNFACTVPVIFFGYTALLGYPLIDVTKSKIVLVFFYPINSCANPFLYTILTASFRRDACSAVTKFGLCVEKEKEYKVIYSTQTANNTQRSTPTHKQTLSITLPERVI